MADGRRLVPLRGRLRGGVAALRIHGTFWRHPVATLRFALQDRRSRRLMRSFAPGTPSDARVESVTHPPTGHAFTVVDDGSVGSVPLLVNEAELAVFDGLPPVHELTDVTYVPVRKGGPIGTGVLVDANGEIVREALLVRHPVRRPRHPTEVTAADLAPGGSRGPAIYIGHLGFRHFGHFLTEGMARLWYIATLPESDGRPFLYHGLPGALDTPIARTVLSELGIEDDRLIRFDRPTRFERLTVPGPSMVNLAAVSEVHREVAERVATGLGLSASGDRDEGPLYLSRTRLPWSSRLIAGEAQLEEAMRGSGVRIVHPQELTIREQMELFSVHQPVIGPIGSAFHVSLFTGRGGAHVYLVDRDVAVNPNCFLLDATGNVDGVYVRCIDTLHGRRAKADGLLRPETTALLSRWIMDS